MIVSVFDPLAVLMLVAANWSLKHIRKEEEPDPDTNPYGEWTEEDMDQIIWDDFLEELNEEPVKQEWDPKFNLDDARVEAEREYVASKTIEEEIEEIQRPTITINTSEISKSGKVIEYDSVGRRITP